MLTVAALLAASSMEARGTTWDGAEESSSERGWAERRLSCRRPLQQSLRQPSREKQRALLSQKCPNEGSCSQWPTQGYQQPAASLGCRAQSSRAEAFAQLPNAKPRGSDMRAQLPRTGTSVSGALMQRLEMTFSATTSATWEGFAVNTREEEPVGAHSHVCDCSGSHLCPMVLLFG